jgi:hypothetical protein
MRNKILRILKENNVDKIVITKVEDIPEETAAWVPYEKRGREQWYFCSKCHWGTMAKYRYCPGCGYEMVNSTEKERRKL